MQVGREHKWFLKVGKQVMQLDGTKYVNVCGWFVESINVVWVSMFKENK